MREIADVIEVYKRIFKAARKGKGIRLTLEEVLVITCDGAVQQAVETAEVEADEEQQ